ncbi:NCS2 family permease [Lutibacter maritimus]|jgi:AGZA family xanthine/uracil permease-like MFS transporter|uniref:Putative MFS transporter, AGZA family, xanthine/uracil permease n=1 Tax=Lutibacter maritimus TaxID=593133 RepID=A0A1I6SL59_9FLAO|nr:NCS2 family permease [Lutibacter maritimus]SFS77600.1 putative MFS transporter, AGZA family, xanthine/uracil permease [Lutibacter maritimus]
MLDKFFKITENKSTLRTEIIAGITTFMTMVYILAVNPSILSAAGMDKDAVFTATALSAVVATLIMALYAKLPFALAPGMGLNAFFAFTVVLGMGYSWEFALTAVFLEGIIFIILTAFNIRELIVNSIPLNLKHAVSVGIGLFIAFIGLKGTGLIVDNPATLVSLGNMKNPEVLVGMAGVLIIGVLLTKKIKGAILIGILVSTIIGLVVGVTVIPENFTFVSLPPSVEPIFFKFDFSQVFSLDMLIVLFTFLFVDMFDTVGTLVGVSSKSGMLDKDGNVPRVKQALFADAIGTFFGAILGTSTVTTYVESAAGVAEGGKTGMTALTVAGMFALALFFAPIFMIIPAAATAPALIIVGLFMISPIMNIDLTDFTEAIPAFFTIIMMPLTYSIAEGIVFGMLSFVLLKLLTGRYKEIKPIMVIIAILFIIKFYV